ncbi:MAG: 4Fe-4S dicluster domain-containing protein [Pseudomonadota bacterium]
MSYKIDMFFHASLYISLTIFILGIFYKGFSWFSNSFDGYKAPTATRIATAIKGIFATICSLKILPLLRVFIFDVLFQVRILRESRLRWAAHMCIYAGFSFLLFMHALDGYVSKNLFHNYYSTLNPFLFLRNFFFLMVLVGLAIAVARRFVQKPPRVITNSMDIYALIIIFVIMVSGVLLEGTKIVSRSSFQDMVDNWAGINNAKDVVALESYWIENFGLASTNVQRPFQQSMLDAGAQVHSMNCAECHSRSSWAFISYGIAKAMQPVGAGLDAMGIPKLLWYIHFLLCFIGLAYLPFSKMFHMFVTPLSLLANAVMDKAISDPSNIAVKQMMELDACTHCGACSERCSVGITCGLLENTNILPAEKISAIRALASGKKFEESQVRAIQEGLVLCTNCTKCTLVCPSGINLHELWFSVRKAVLLKGHAEPLLLSVLSYPYGLITERLSDYTDVIDRARQAMNDSCRPIDETRLIDLEDGWSKGLKEGLSGSSQGETFSYCFTCKTCTLSCPVVKAFDGNIEALGLLPHQIMHASQIGLSDLVFSSQMLWACLGCYQCQENCPQGAHVTDIFFTLKNMAMKQVRGR